MTDLHDLGLRAGAALGGALLAEARAGTPTGAHHLLAAAESLGSCGELRPDDLRDRGLGAVPPCGPAGIPIRSVAAALLAPADRPALRRHAAALAQISPAADFGTVAVTVATGVLALDLLRFDLATALLRLHQTLLEDAPILVLRRLCPLGAEAVAPADTESGAALQLAITGLAEATGVEAVCAAVLARQPSATIAVSLAAALAGLRDAAQGLDPERYEGLPGGDRVGAAAGALVDRAERSAASARPSLSPVTASDPA
ncbi:MAG: hypothetical protein NVSMB29_08410 [Candidatus Dormibacteria bacterium]